MQDYRKKYKDYFHINFGAKYVVHHIDMNRQNNDIDNLLLLPAKLHSLYHARLNDLQTLCRLSGNECAGKTHAVIDFAIISTDEINYSEIYLLEMQDVLKECAKWADYKKYLSGKIPNIHKIMLEE